MLAVHKNAAAKRSYTKHPTSGPVVTTWVNRSAWAAALTLADGDRRRLRVVDATTILVVNAASGAGPRAAL